jgi:hypothetical protein
MAIERAAAAESCCSPVPAVSIGRFLHWFDFSTRRRSRGGERRVKRHDTLITLIETLIALMETLITLIETLITLIRGTLPAPCV